MTYETRYVIVAGIAWIRRTRVGRDEHVWLVVFGDGEPRARKGPAGECSTRRGELDGVSWRLDAESLAPPFRSRLSQYATHERAPGLPLARGRVEMARVHVGPLTVEADPATFAGLRYTDTDRSPTWCYHSERAHGLLDVECALEIAGCAPVPGWRVAL